ncbi:MAG: glycogen/starch/alpha-glucan phosphorylase [Balneolaceae bacterium]|nr:glycogen/starch/alpha-glucan phosphorylase [Balneolaceae bacterium]
MSHDYNGNPRTGMDVDAFKRDIQQHLRYTLAKDELSTTEWDNYRSVVLSVMDRLHERWMTTQQRYYKEESKRVYYISMEFLIGRLMDNMLINLGMQDVAAEAFKEVGLDYEEVREAEVDAGLGNGGLGRLAACYLDSMATLGIPALGYGIRYDYGIFDQEFDNGWQLEKPDLWLQYGYPWGIVRPKIQFPVKFYGETTTYEDRDGHTRFDWINTHDVQALAYDTPIPGYQNDVVNHLRLWKATSAHAFDLESFNDGDYVDALRTSLEEENISRVLYPNDKVFKGQELRLKQEYFLVACSLRDAFDRFKVQFDDLNKIPDKMAIQCNDTHPNLAIPELMRLLMDEEGLGWNQSWEIVTETIHYTNHTLMPEALEKWPLSLMSNLLPRHVQIIREIDKRFQNSIEVNTEAEENRKDRMRIITDEMNAKVRMGNLGVIGARKINGVSEIHSELMKETTFKDFQPEFADKFENVTNGITPRRWLRQCNRPLADLISEHIGDEWVSDLDQLQQIEPLADDASFREQFANIKQQNKQELAAYIKQELGIEVDPHSIFDIHVKRIHEYKRQLLNIFHAITLYNRIKAGAELENPVTKLFAGKAAPGYTMAKLHIKLIHSVAEKVNNDPDVNDQLKIVFLPNYSVSLAERMIPAANLSEQISTAGMEASGTGNMKFALNGALTIGTLDGANIEIRERVGKENIFIFGNTVDEINELKSAGYEPSAYVDHNEELQQIFARLSDGFFEADDPEVFHPVTNALLNQGDYYMLLADYKSYIDEQDKANHAYSDSEEWNRKAIVNVANMGHFSSDRSIQNYAEKIWQL